MASKSVHTWLHLDLTSWVTQSAIMNLGTITTGLGRPNTVLEWSGAILHMLSPPLPPVSMFLLVREESDREFVGASCYF